MKKCNLRTIFALMAGVAWVAIAATFATTPSTETVISLSDGLHVGKKATDRIGFYNAAPTARPVSGLPLNTTPLPTLTPGNTPVGSAINPTIAQVNALTVLVNTLQMQLAAQGLCATPTATATATATATSP